MANKNKDEDEDLLKHHRELEVIAIEMSEALAGLIPYGCQQKCRHKRCEKAREILRKYNKHQWPDFR